jgi:hypothetical protein
MQIYLEPQAKDASERSGSDRDMLFDSEPSGGSRQIVSSMGKPSQNYCKSELKSFTLQKFPANPYLSLNPYLHHYKFEAPDGLSNSP